MALDPDSKRSIQQASTAPHARLTRKHKQSGLEDAIAGLEEEDLHLSKLRDSGVLILSAKDKGPKLENDKNGLIKQTQTIADSTALKRI